MKRNNAFSLRGIAISGLVILLFVGIILAYYFMLLSETRERITKTGELNAMTLAKPSGANSSHVSPPSPLTIRAIQGCDVKTQCHAFPFASTSR